MNIWKLRFHAILGKWPSQTAVIAVFNPINKSQSQKKLRFCYGKLERKNNHVKWGARRMEPYFGGIWKWEVVLVQTLVVCHETRVFSVWARLGSRRVSIVSLGSDDVCAVVCALVTPRIFVPALMFVFVNRRRRGFVWSDFCICYTVIMIFGRWASRRMCGLWWNRRGLEDWFDCFTLTHSVGTWGSIFTHA